MISPLNNKKILGRSWSSREAKPHAESNRSLDRRQFLQKLNEFLSLVDPFIALLRADETSNEFEISMINLC